MISLDEEAEAAVDNSWMWWLGAALLLAVAEILSLDLVLAMLAAAALVGGVLAALGAPLQAQILGFAATSALLLLALRPYLLAQLRRRIPLEETNVAGHVGRLAVVVSEVSERDGRVKLAGEVWSARTEDDEVVAVGEEVRVVRIAGATAVVAPVTGRRPVPPTYPTAPPSHVTPPGATPRPAQEDHP